LEPGDKLCVMRPASTPAWMGSYFYHGRQFDAWLVGGVDHGTLSIWCNDDF
jgi:hypothetical protein